MFHRMKIKPHERGLLFREGEPIAVLQPGVHWYLDPLLKLRLQIVSPRNPWAGAQGPGAHCEVRHSRQ